MEGERVSIYVVGDCHGDIDLKKLNHRGRKYYNIKKDDYVIVCGDWGAI